MINTPEAENSAEHVSLPAAEEEKELSAPASGPMEDNASKPGLSGAKKLVIVFFMVLSLLLAVLCLLLFASTLPKAGHLEYSGVYRLSHAYVEGALVPAEDLAQPPSVRLSDNGWCRLSFGGEEFTGRWSAEGEKLSIRCMNSLVEGRIDKAAITIENIFGRGIDLVLSRG